MQMIQYEFAFNLLLLAIIFVSFFAYIIPRLWKKQETDESSYQADRPGWKIKTEELLILGIVLVFGWLFMKFFNELVFAFGSAIYSVFEPEFPTFIMFSVIIMMVFVLISLVFLLWNTVHIANRLYKPGFSSQVNRDLFQQTLPIVFYGLIAWNLFKRLSVAGAGIISRGPAIFKYLSETIWSGFDFNNLFVNLSHSGILIIANLLLIAATLIAFKYVNPLSRKLTEHFEKTSAEVQ